MWCVAAAADAYGDGDDDGGKLTDVAPAICFVS
jgi:hypothetical protein